jgi:hypothetical protein
LRATDEDELTSAAVRATRLTEPMLVFGRTLPRAFRVRTFAGRLALTWTTVNRAPTRHRNVLFLAGTIMTLENDADKALEERMATAKRELLERHTQDQKACLIQAEHVLRDVVLPAFATYEESDHSKLFLWRASPVRTTTTFANGAEAFGTTGAQLGLTRSNDRGSTATLRIMYVQGS